MLSLGQEMLSDAIIRSRMRSDDIIRSRNAICLPITLLHQRQCELKL